MPDIEDACREEDAVLWPFSGYDDQGEPEVGEPVELKVRWEEAREDNASPGGDAITTPVSVLVDRRIAVHSHMWLGTLADWYLTGSAGQDTGLMIVVSSKRVPDLKARSVLYMAGLIRLYDK